MPQGRSQSVTPLSGEAIARYSEVALYLLVLSGFVTLASTGGLGLFASLPVAAALAVRAYLLLTRRRFQLSPRWTSVITIAYVVFYLADYLLISREFLASTVHLVLFVMLVRLYSIRRERDTYFLAVIAFVMVLASAMLTVSSLFVVAFAFFLLIAVAAFILMEMKQASANVAVPSRPRTGPPAVQAAFTVAKISPALVLLILVGAAVIFFLLPRISAGFLSAYSPRNEIATGFSDRVELGRIGEIQQSNAVVMHIRIDGDTTGRSTVKWRGVVLNHFDGHSWSSSRWRVPLRSHLDGRFTFDPARAAYRAGAGLRPEFIHYRVLAEPIGTDVFFLAPVAGSLQGNYRYIAHDGEGSVFDMDPEHPIAVYDALSDIARPDPAALRLAPSVYSAEFPVRYLQVPPLDPRIPRLANEITQGAGSNYDKAAALEAYLRGHYGYTLQLPHTPPRDPLADFLFERKRGHCEYFASAMAVMLRTLNMPSRVAIGFSGGEFNDLTSQYVIRARDAHSWVEAYFPGYGWISFDPTPPGGASPSGGWERIMLYADAASSFWREWIVNYDVAHQQTFATALNEQGRHFFFRTRRWYWRTYRRLLTVARQSQSSISASPLRWGATGFLGALALAIAINFRRLWRIFQRRRLASRPERAPRTAASLWYERMLRKVARRGWKKSPVQTSREFAESIGDPLLRRSVQRFTRRYESARFGNSPQDAARLPELYEEITSSDRR